MIATRWLPAALATIALLASAPAAGQTPAGAPPIAPAAVAPAAEIMVGPALPGAFFQRPGGPGRYPAIILIGGSEGGDFAARRWARLFLAEGYAVLGLPYYVPPYLPPNPALAGLPAAFASIPLDRLATARDWLRGRRDVRADRIGIYGASKGAEFALAGAQRIPGFAAIAAIVPSDVIWEGWGPGIREGQSSSFAWRGRALPFVPYIGMAEEFAKFGRPGETPRLRTPQDAGRHANPGRVEPARIRVETIAAPVLVAGGDQDPVWASGEMAQAIAERRAAAGRATTVFIFPDAGHALTGTGTPPAGGARSQTAAADLAAQRVLWPATLAFFAQNLKRP